MGKNDLAMLAPADPVSLDVVLNFSRPLTVGEAVATNWPRREYILGPLQAGDVGLISGADGVGKSWVALAAGLSVGYGISACGMFDVPTGRSGRAIYFAVEDRRADHGRRLAAIVRHIKKSEQIDGDDDTLTLVPMEGRRLPLVLPNPSRSDARGPYIVAEAGEAWAKYVEDYRLVIIDPLRAFHDMQESDGAAMDFLVRWLVSVAMRNQQAILLVHHASQNAILESRSDHHAGRGATDLPAGCRGVWTIRVAKFGEVPGVQDEGRRRWRVLVNAKASHAAEGATRYLAQSDDGVLVAADPPPNLDADKANKPNKPTKGESKYGNWG